MSQVYGQSDDNVYIDGDYSGQYSYFSNNYEKKGIMLILSDGTILEIKYGKAGLGIWGILVIKKGVLFDHIDYCIDDDADIYSDIAYFRKGISYVYGCSEWELIK